MSNSNETSRRPTFTRRAVLTSTVAVAGLTLHPRDIWAIEDGISNSSQSIHQEPIFQVERRRIYEALTDARQFDQIIRLGAAMRSGAIESKPSKISSQVGGTFSLFGGYIVGRHLDLVRNRRIVQAWRAQSWGPGEYSIVKFDLREQGSATRIIFDHKGFPAGKAQHLAAGWRGNYWEPLEKYLAQKPA